MTDFRPGQRRVTRELLTAETFGRCGGLDGGSLLPPWCCKQWRVRAANPFRWRYLVILCTKRVFAAKNGAADLGYDSTITGRRRPIRYPSDLDHIRAAASLGARAFATRRFDEALKNSASADEAVSQVIIGVAPRLSHAAQFCQLPTTCLDGHELFVRAAPVLPEDVNVTAQCAEHVEMLVAFGD